MANALIAQDLGKRYQAWLFWEFASQLLLPDTNVAEVRFEEGVRAFDDIVVRFDPARTVGHRETVTHYNVQAKYHITSGGSFRIESMTDPEFIGAKDASLLSRLGDAFRTLGEEEFLRRDFWIHSPWGLHPDDDALRQLWRQNEKRLDLAVLARGTRGTSGWVKLRERWRDETRAESDDQLMAMISRLRLGHSHGGVSEQDARVLSLHLRAAGLKPVDHRAAVEPYSAIPWNLHLQKRTRFTREEIERIVDEEDLRLEPPARPQGTRLGIRTRVEWGDHMEAECEALLPLEGLFDGRKLRDGVTWADVYSRVGPFLRDHSRDGVRKLLDLAAPITVAFAGGYALARMGRPVFPLQRGPTGEVVWDAAQADVQGGGWHVHRDEGTGTGGTDVAVGFSLTREVWNEMGEYVSREAPEIGRVVELRTAAGPGHESVRGGGHARHLSEDAVRVIRGLRAPGVRTAHLFLAVPNGFAFLLGQEGERIGRCQLYEFDFPGEHDGSYWPSLLTPDQTRPSSPASR